VILKIYVWYRQIERGNNEKSIKVVPGEKGGYWSQIVI
jgi:hypothetical protein